MRKTILSGLVGLLFAAGAQGQAPEEKVVKVDPQPTLPAEVVIVEEKKIDVQELITLYREFLLKNYQAEWFPATCGSALISLH